jgi:hypothetical protein
MKIEKITTVLPAEDGSGDSVFVEGSLMLRDE